MVITSEMLRLVQYGDNHWMHLKLSNDTSKNSVATIFLILISPDPTLHCSVEIRCFERKTRCDWCLKEH